MSNIPESQLVKNQTKTFGPRKLNDRETITATVRYDDECGNGYNTFAVTAEIRNRIGRPSIHACGCLHDEVSKAFPELNPIIKWHLVSTDGPMHYVENTQYWVREGNLEYARSAAVWPEASADQLRDVTELENRLPKLMVEFKRECGIDWF